MPPPPSVVVSSVRHCTWRLRWRRRGALGFQYLIFLPLPSLHLYLLCCTVYYCVVGRNASESDGCLKKDEPRYTYTVLTYTTYARTQTGIFELYPSTTWVGPTSLVGGKAIVPRRRLLRPGRRSAEEGGGGSRNPKTVGDFLRRVSFSLCENCGTAISIIVPKFARTATAFHSN